MAAPAPAPAVGAVRAPRTVGPLWAGLAESRHRLRPPGEGVGADRSLVAGVNALFRAAEARRPAADRILNDPFAEVLGERHPLITAIAHARPVLPPLRRELDRLQVAHCTRHRALDVLVEAALADGFTQVVLVGAGYDTRVLRLPGAAAARWYEVDRPGTFARKAARLVAVLGGSARSASAFGPGSSAIAVPADVRNGLAAPLVQAGFDATQPSCYVLEGLVHYLPPAVLDRLAAELTPQARVLVSFIDPVMVPAASVVFTSLVKVLREAPRQTFTAADLAARFPGFRLAGHWPFAAQVSAFAPAAAGRSVGVSQDVAQLDRG